jgi:hypothetical protein
MVGLFGLLQVSLAVLLHDYDTAKRVLRIEDVANLMAVFT